MSEGSDGCLPFECCRCQKGPDVAWLGAMEFGDHTLCMTCYYDLGSEWGCDVDV